MDYKKTEEFYKEMNEKISDLSSLIAAKNDELAEMKKVLMIELDKEKLKEYQDKKFNNRWFTECNLNKDQETGSISFYHIEKATKPRVDEYGNPIIDTAIDIEIIIESFPNQDKNIREMFNVKKRLKLRRIKEIPGMVVRAKVEAAINTLATRLNMFLGPVEG